MTLVPLTWSDRAASAIKSLATKPWCLYFLLLATNALARPYAGITHDARLYSAQVLSQLEPGAFGDDLFFRYGSQDQFSIFSRFAAPFVHVLGAHAAFFLLYLVFNSLLILALKNLVEALIADRLVSTLALVFMMAATLNFGGLSSFHVQEIFLTARVLANALVAFGLERTLRGQFFLALGLIILAMAFHPLMAFGGFLIWAGTLAWSVLPGKLLVFLTSVLGIAGTLVLATPSLATGILGTMDESWHEVILRATPFIFVSQWKASDWLNIAMGLIGLAAAAGFRSRESGVRSRRSEVEGQRSEVGLTTSDLRPLTSGFRPPASDLRLPDSCLRRRFLVMVAIVSVAAVVGTALAECLPYALLVQGQPYRALWILKVLQIPFAFWFASRLWRMPQWYGPVGAAALVGVLGLTTNMALERCFPLFFLPVLVVRYRGLSHPPLYRDWWPRSLMASLVLGFLGWALYKLVLLTANHAAILEHLDLLDFARLLIENIGPITWLVLFAVFALWAARRPHFSRGMQGACAVVILLVQGAMAMLPASPSFRENYTRYGKDIRVIQEFLRQRHAPAMPTIYSCLGRLDLVWLDLHAKSYFDWWQMSGVMFQRQTAMEGQRRALVVGPFELDRFRRAGDIPEYTREQVSRFFALDFDTAAPNLDNLKRLCEEDGIDFLLLTHEFPGLVTAATGRIYVYDCRQVRAALNLPSPAIAKTLSPRSEAISP
jgi:hypothetical protein